VDRASQRRFRASALVEYDVALLQEDFPHPTPAGDAGSWSSAAT
jgi:hypothetical protein